MCWPPLGLRRFPKVSLLCRITVSALGQAMAFECLEYFAVLQCFHSSRQNTLAAVPSGWNRMQDCMNETGTFARSSLESTAESSCTWQDCRLNLLKDKSGLLTKLRSAPVLCKASLRRNKAPEEDGIPNEIVMNLPEELPNVDHDDELMTSSCFVM